MRMSVKFIMVHLVLVILGCDWFKQSELPEVTVKNETGVTLENVRLNGESQDIQDGDRHSWQVNDDATMAITFDYNGKTFSTSEKFGKGDTATIHTDTSLSDGKKFGAYIIFIKISNLSGVTLEDVRWNGSDAVDMQNGDTKTFEGKNDSNRPIIFRYDGQERTTEESYSKGTNLTINGNTSLVGGTKFGDHIINAPDILIEELTFNKSSSKIEGKIRNDGNVDVTEQFYVEFWVSSDDSKSPNDDMDLGAKYFTRMKASYSEHFTLPVTLPEDFDKGYIIAIIDPKNSIVNEKNTNNNKFSYKYYADATPRPIISSSSSGTPGTNEVRISVDIANNGGIVTARGVVYSTSSLPTRGNSWENDGGSGTGAFTCHLTNLSPSTTYYIRAYAVGEDGSTVYGSELQVTTKAEEFTISGSFYYNSISIEDNDSEDEYPHWSNHDSEQTVEYSISPNNIPGIRFDRDDGEITVLRDADPMVKRFHITAIGTGKYGGNPIYATIDVEVRSEPASLSTAKMESSTSQVYTGEEIKLTATVKNWGGTTSETTSFYVYYSDNGGSIHDGHTRVKTVSVAPINANSSKTIEISITAPSNPGTYYYALIKSGDFTSIHVAITVLPPIYKITELRFQLLDPHEPDGDNTAELIILVTEWDSHGGRELLSDSFSISKNNFSKWYDIPDTQTPNFWVRLTDEDAFLDDVVSGSTGKLDYTSGTHNIEFGGDTGPKVKFYYVVERVD